LTLANIDSVILDLHRLGCKRPGQKKYSTTKKNSVTDNEPPPESLSDLKYHHLFGAGTFGRVWCVTKVGGKTPYALKIQSKRELLDQRQASSAVRERGVMAKLDHPFVCKLVASYQDDACIYMLLALVQGGELLNLIQGGESYGGLPESAAKFYAAGIAEGLTYMHRR
jgi:cGMP-dependent protein kinase